MGDLPAALDALSQEVRELSLGLSGRVERLDAAPTPLAFYRDYVAEGKPCVIANGVAHWPALQRWTNSYLCGKLGDKRVSVDITPGGRGDAVRAESGHFVLPEERRLPLADFFALLARSRQQPELGVPYVQHQNSSLTGEFPELLGDVEAHIPWATEALGCQPEAANLWIGDERAATSFHKDHYENLYAVVCGRKTFTLLPPCDMHRMYLQPYPCARYRFDASARPPAWAVDEEVPRREVLWTEVEPAPGSAPVAGDGAAATSRASFPRFFEGPPPLVCEVGEGDLLFLPSMYYHFVEQRCGSEGRCIAVNFWYDMRFDVRYAYFAFMEKLWQQHIRASDSREEGCQQQQS